MTEVNKSFMEVHSYGLVLKELANMACSALHNLTNFVL